MYHDVRNSEVPMDAVEALENLELLGTDHWGLVTTSQARENGISRLWMQRLSDRGAIHRLRHGVYALPSSRPGALQDIQAAWLSITAGVPPQAPQSIPHRAVVSGATAAAVYEIGDLVPPYIEISVPQARMTKQHDLRLLHRELPSKDVGDFDGLPITTVERTIYDLSLAATDFDHLTALVVDAARRPEASIVKITKSLEIRATTEGYPSSRAMLQEMLATRGLDIDSLNQKPDAYQQISQIIAASLDPEIFENLSSAVSTIFKAQGLTGSNELAKIWAEIVKDRIPDLSAATTNMLKTAMLQANKNNEHDSDHDDEQEEG